MTENKNLIPQRHSPNLFTFDLVDVVFKDVQQTMEHPIFSLSKNPDLNIRHYESGRNSITITPSVLGIATVFDKDILVYCLSLIMRDVNKGKKPSRTVRITAHDLLVATKRQTQGRGYKLLRDAFKRIDGTRIETNIKTNEESITEGFGLIDYYKVVEKSPTNGRMVAIEVKLSKWIYNAVAGKEILTISKGYFELKRAIDRRIYQIARKHCGVQGGWTIGIELLLKKTGSGSNLREFKRLLKPLLDEKTGNYLPDYNIEFKEETQQVIFTPKTSLKDVTSNSLEKKNKPFLFGEDYEKAKEFAPGMDIHVLESKWLAYWKKTGCKALKNPSGAFFKFCAKVYLQSKSKNLLKW